MDLKDAAEVVLDAANHWRTCRTCGGFGGVFMSEGVSDGVYRKCRTCKGKGHFLRAEARWAFKLLGVEKPTNPGPRRIM